MLICAQLQPLAQLPSVVPISQRLLPASMSSKFWETWDLASLMGPGRVTEFQFVPCFSCCKDKS